MISEFFTYLLAKSTKEARSFGHLYESIALIEREKRCRAFWFNHREMSKKVITSSVEKIKKKSSVLILGSGPLHEIPIEFLSASFNRVDLVDVVHLNSTKMSLKKFKNISFIEADVTELESCILKEKKPFNKIPTQFIKSGYDLVISANLLSQLSYHLTHFLEKNATPKLSLLELEHFANQVTLDHYLYLQSFICPVLLITDTETLLEDMDHNLIERENPYINFSFPIPIQEWWWNVAPIPEYQKDIALKMKVQAFLLNLR